MSVTLIEASADDASAIAALHAASWRSAYRGLMPDSFLDNEVVAERLQFWTRRMAEPHEARLLVKAVEAGGALAGFTCVLRDADPAWGPLLDNLHVRPDLKGTGIGRRLLQRSRDWSETMAPGAGMHLWVIEGNVPARRFYERQGGTVAERRTVETVPGIPVVALRFTWPSSAFGELPTPNY